MNNISFHITDITANSIRARATVIDLILVEKQGTRSVTVADNGCGMDAETLHQVTNPFYTTRTTRKVGLGLPFLKQNVEQTGGELQAWSKPGEGTRITAIFKSGHIDCPPWGDLAGTVALLITGNPDVDIRFHYETDTHDFAISSKEIMEALDGIPLSHPQVSTWLTEMIRENIL
ncbi:sensor histidine kinase [Parabacteroides sp. OttesenSCG-928-O15]|nr:sensor histidine kinase [Parabacteroides sp. OttesenSCG-928-O15]